MLRRSVSKQQAHFPFSLGAIRLYVMLRVRSPWPVEVLARHCMLIKDQKICSTIKTREPMVLSRSPEYLVYTEM